MVRVRASTDWTRIGFRLVTATLIYNVFEALVALWAGEAADSIALIGFGLDSIIEVLASAVLLWRLGIGARGATSMEIARSEHKARRLIGLTFMLLALYVSGMAARTLWVREPPGESIVGIVLAMVSLVIMPLIAWGKLRAGREIGSAALRAEARETLACSYLSFTLLAGLLANALAGWWWADPVAALLMVPWLAKEGAEGLGLIQDDD